MIVKFCYKRINDSIKVLFLHITVIWLDGHLISNNSKIIIGHQKMKRLEYEDFLRKDVTETLFN